MSKIKAITKAKSGQKIFRGASRMRQGGGKFRFSKETMKKLHAMAKAYMLYKGRYKPANKLYKGYKTGKK